MQGLVEIERIEEMRRAAGIEDDELRDQIRGLAVGDFVQVTFLSGVVGGAGETLTVRITQIQGDSFRGKLGVKPASVGLSKLHVGSPVRFSTVHIHSVPKRQCKHE